MQHYQTLATVELFTGIVSLTQQQAASRPSQLNHLGEGLYEIVKPVQFKAGEVLAYDGPVNKAFMQSVAYYVPKARKK